jgi:phenylpropionate dioxygenase-like ring-hydroxylating dioxygenase large terminal subunit
VRGLPASAYLDPARGPLEASTIFARSWQFVCHCADLPSPGTAARFDCAGRSAFVLRTRSGALHAFLNACPHRGSRLVDGDPGTGLAFCVDGRVRCPYHGWTFDESGALDAVPPAQQYVDLDVADRSLRPLPVAQWRGLVFVAFERPERGLDDALGAASSAWPDATVLRRLREPRVSPVAADWKLVCEHWLDRAHWAVARPTLTPRLFVEEVVEPVGPDALHVRGRLDPRAAETPWPARLYRDWTRRAGRAETGAQWLFVWPNLWLQATPDALVVMQALPRGTGACTVRSVSYGHVDQARETRLLRYLHERTQRRARGDDARQLERVQQGLACLDGTHTPPLAVAESALRWFVTRCDRAGLAPVARRARRRAPRKRVATVDA